MQHDVEALSTLQNDKVKKFTLSQEDSQPVQPSEINPDLTEIELLKLIHKHLFSTWAGGTLAMVVTIVAFWGVTPKAYIITWSSLLLAVMLLRVWNTKRCPIDETEINIINKWKREFIILQAMAGSIWGSMPFLLLQSPDIPLLAIITAILFATNILTLSSFSLILPSYYFYVVLSLLPLSIYNFLLGGNFHLAVAFCIFFIIFIFIKYARNINKAMRESFRLRFENLDLIVRLKKEKQKAEKANHDKSQFLASASHDLRQPLHSLGLFLGSMENYIDNADAKSLLDKSNHSLASLKELLDSLLDISKLDAGTIDINKRHFFLSSLFEKMEEEFQHQAEKKQLEFNITFGNQTLYTDPVLLSRCLRNFIINAIKHTDSGKIIVDCHEYDEQYRIEIHDTGSGIPEDQFENIFDEFYQLENPERDRSKGLGLGLAIVKHLSVLLGYQVGVESIIGKGSCFYIIVPKGNSDKVITQETLFNVEHHNQTASILIIDDEKDVLEATASMLKQWKHKVEAVDSIENAILILEGGFIPEFIVSDYRLRDNVNGIDAIEKINQYLSKKIPSIIITGDTSPERIKEVNATDHLLVHKPVTPLVLRNAINHLISHNLN